MSVYRDKLIHLNELYASEYDEAAEYASEYDEAADVYEATLAAYDRGYRDAIEMCLQQATDALRHAEREAERDD